MTLSRSLSFLCLLLPLLSTAQDTGRITGTVYDPSAAKIIGADVVVADVDRGLVRKTKSNNTGDYLFAGLPSGLYSLTVSAKGFKKLFISGITLRVAQSARADAKMQVGGPTTETTVSGSTVGQVETQSSELSGILTEKQVASLPLNGRNFTQLIVLTPGVNNQTGQDEGIVGLTGNVRFSFNGGRGEYNSWEIDGGDILGGGGTNSNLNVYPSIDSIAEVKVLTSNYGAQYGRNASGTVEVETKSGTSKFNGNAYEFVRNTAFNARSFSQSIAPPYHKNDFGYTLGGPLFIPKLFNVEKQKTFFFWSQEWRKESVPVPFYSNVPSTEERQGNFNDLCPALNQSPESFPDCPVDPRTGTFFPNHQVPVSEVGAALLPLIPLPNAGQPGSAIYNASASQPTRWREELLRVDQNLGSKMRAMFRYIHDTWDTVSPTTPWSLSFYPTVQTNFIGPGISAVTRLGWDISPTFENELLFAYTTAHITFTSTGTPNPNAWRRPQGLPMGAIFNNGFGGKLPSILLIGNSAYGGYMAEDPNGGLPEGLYTSDPTYMYRDDATKILGRHNLKFGASFVAAQQNELSIQPVSGSLTFNAFNSTLSTHNAFADLLMGQVTSYRQANTNLKFYYRYKLFEPYLQDEWRANSRLTVSMGLRISMFGTYRERYGRIYNWDPRAYDRALAPQIDVSGSVTGWPGALVPGVGNRFDGLVQCGTHNVPSSCMEGQLFNPAPRVGFSFDPLGKGTMAIRGGYGIFFQHSPGGETTTQSLGAYQSSPLIQTVTQTNISGYQNIGRTLTGSSPEFPLGFESIPGKEVWPYVQHWHLDFQTMIKGTVGTLSYVGSKGTHLGQQEDINQIEPVSDAENPYKIGEPIGGVNNSGKDCKTFLTPSGVAISGKAANNLAVACGGDPNPYRPYYGLDSIIRLSNAASSSYHALQVSALRNVGALQFNIAYTWSHSIDDASDRYDSTFPNANDRAARRASSNFDARHMLNVAWIYDVPFPAHDGTLSKLLSGWRYSGIATWLSGSPYTIFILVNYFDNAGVGNRLGFAYPDRVAGSSNRVPTSSPAPAFLGPLFSNPSAFAAPRGLTFGNAGRNGMRGPSYSNYNMALVKDIPAGKNLHFEFRAEAFNIFNNTEWGQPNLVMNCYGGTNNSAGDPGCLQNSNFLHITSTHPARILQLSLKLQF